MKITILLSALLVVASASSVARSPIAKLKDIKPESRIVGGSLAEAGQFPYQVWLSISSSYGGWDCGGSIIDAEWILTAAHCTYGASEIVVIAGSLNIEQLEDTVQTRTASQVIIHPQYELTTLKNDISLIRLSSPLQLTYKVWPVPLVDRSEVNDSFEGEHVIASGWGRTSDAGPAPSQLRYVDMYVESQAACIGYYGSVTVTDGVICTYTEYGTKSTCQGDSGGPLVSKATGHLIGCTSFVSSTGCQSGAPDGFTRITYYLDWIQQTTGLVV
ncbi:hypothetical protein ACFFRR_011130 [Megaselia abdita]